MAQLHPPLIGSAVSYEHSLWDEGHSVTAEVKRAAQPNCGQRSIHMLELLMAHRKLYLHNRVCFEKLWS